MWQRFTGRARKVVFYAQEEAMRFGHGYVGTEHLLLGLVREYDSVAARVFEILGVPLEQIRKEVDLVATRGNTRSSQDMTLTTRAKDSIDLAYKEAVDLQNNYIGTEHILLGLIREEGDVASLVLTKLGVEIEKARAVVKDLHDAETKSKPPATVAKLTTPTEELQSSTQPKGAMWSRFTERARRVVFNAQEEAQGFGEGYVSTEHLLLGLIREPGSVALDVLATMGVKADRLHIEVEKQLPKGDPKPSQELMLTPRGRRVIDLAYDEARNLFNNYIGTEHLLLALIREGDGLAGRALKKMGVRLEPARKLVKEIQEKVAES